MSPGAVRVAVCQMRSGIDVAANLAQMCATIDAAAGAGAWLVAFPENAPLLGPAAVRLAGTEPLDGPQVRTIREAAARAGVHVLLGSFAEATDRASHSYNTSVLIDRRGVVVASYRKIHLFDVDVAADTRFRESDTVSAGPLVPTVASLDGWSIGLSICYDLRFPELYRALAAQGADLLCVPAAFTWRTGAAHWETLLRARAIENQAWVLAPAQHGQHEPGRETWGHAMVVSPWGDVVAQHPAGIGVVYADLTRAAIDDARRQIPALTHRRMG